MSSSSTSASTSSASTTGAGSMTITEPNTSSSSIYLKIQTSNLITIGWSLTGVVSTPTSLTFSAICDNGNTYPVGPNSNGAVAGTETQLVWDLYSYQQANVETPLAQATYTLTVWDDRGPSASSTAGYMTQNDALVFAMYTPQAYTPLASGWEYTASGTRLLANPLFFGILVTFVVMILSGFHLMIPRRRA